MICEGTRTRWVTRERSISSSMHPASKAGCRMYVPPRNIQGMRSRKAPLKTMEPAWRKTLSGDIRNTEAKSVQ